MSPPLALYHTQFYVHREEVGHQMTLHSSNCSVLAGEYPVSFFSYCFSVMMWCWEAQSIILPFLRLGLSVNAEGHSYGFSSESALELQSICIFR